MSDEPRRWICVDPDVVCLQGGCGYCTPDRTQQSAESIRKEHRRWTLQQVGRYVDRMGIEVSDQDLRAGMRRQRVDE